MKVLQYQILIPNSNLNKAIAHNKLVLHSLAPKVQNFPICALLNFFPYLALPFIRSACTMNSYVGPPVKD